MLIESGCYHCGEPLPRGADYRLLIDGREQRLCCPACLAVSECIVASGLGDYYLMREQHAERPGDSRDDFAQYDVPAVYQQFSHAIDGGWRSQLSIADMHCAACAWLIEARLGELPGVMAVHVNLQRGAVTIDWQLGQCQLSALFAAINQLGYCAQAWSAQGHWQQLNAQRRALLRRLGVAGVAMMQLLMVAIALYAGDFQGIDSDSRQLLRWYSLALATPVIFYSSQPFFKGAWRSIRGGRLGMDVPVSLALLAAYGASVRATLSGTGHVYFDTVSMFSFFLLLSRYVQGALQMRREAAMRPLLPMTARKCAADGSIEWLALPSLREGDELIVQPGEVVPADGQVVAGSSSVEDSVFSGEFMPRNIAVGDAVLAGCHNIDGSLRLRVSRASQQCRLSQIDKLLDSARGAKPATSELADRISGHFTALVLCCSVAAYAYWALQPGHSAFLTALAVLVVSCPCALSLATPSSYAAAVSALRRRGVLVANAAVLESLASISHVIFDKTGTLTEGRPQLLRVESQSGYSDRELLSLAAALESGSPHPIARAFTEDALRRAGYAIDARTVCRQEIKAGQGVSGDIDGRHYRIGRREFCAVNAARSRCSEEQMTVYLSEGEQLIGRFVLQDSLRCDAQASVAEFRRRGIRTLLLSGDVSAEVARLAADMGFDDYRASCSAGDKLQRIRQLQQGGAVVMMVGDGVNDAPVMAAADVSVAMAGASDLTNSCADVLLLNDQLSLLSTVFVVAAKMRRVLRQNIVWALLYNGCALPAAALGLVPPWLAAIGMSLSSLVVVINALRLDRQPLAVTPPVLLSAGEPRWQHG